MSDSLKLLIIVSTSKSGDIANKLGKAALRRGITWAVFFTNDGVQALTDKEFAKTVSLASQAIACQESWQHYMPTSDCPVELGSQTNNSKLAGKAEHIVSL